MRSIAAFLLCIFVFIGPSYALDATHQTQLQPGAVLTISASAGTAVVAREITITHVHGVRSDDGSRWYQVQGSSSDNREELLYVDLSATPPKLELMVNRVGLRKLVDRPRKFLDAVENEEKGELVLDGEIFKYNDKESDDGVLEPDGDQAAGREFNYLVFTSATDARKSLQIMRWDEDRFDTYLILQIKPGDVQLK
jgi:hypothetical protein